MEPQTQTTDLPPNSQLIQQGAEARVFKSVFLGKEVIVKERFVKKYRHPVLDKKLTTKRLNQEARCIVKCSRSGVRTPTVYFVDTENRRLYLEFINGCSIKKFIFDNPLFDQNKLSEKVGQALAKIHDAGVIHGDLTTSNMILKENSEELVFIDFGLGYVSSLVEDKAVDLYVLERAFLSTHPNSEILFEAILAVYGKFSKQANAVLKKLEEVRARGRKKLAFG